MTIPQELTTITSAILIIVQIIKGVGIPKKYLPLVSLALGIAGAIALNVGGSITGNIILGIMAGGSASGLYDAGSSIKNIK